MPSAQSLTRFLVSPEAHLSITEYESTSTKLANKQTLIIIIITIIILLFYSIIFSVFFFFSLSPLYINT
jgi:hypothetical protein